MEEQTKPITKRQYVDNVEFLRLLKEYNDQPVPRIISEELGEMFRLIVDNIAYSRQFINYTEDWKNEMKSDALFNFCRYLGTFDCNKSSNPFAYFTMIAMNAFKMRIKKEKFKNFKDSVIKEEIYNEFLTDFKICGTDKNRGSDDYNEDDAGLHEHDFGDSNSEPDVEETE